MTWPVGCAWNVVLCMCHGMCVNQRTIKAMTKTSDSTAATPMMTFWPERDVRERGQAGEEQGRAAAMHTFSYCGILATSSPKVGSTISGSNSFRKSSSSPSGLICSSAGAGDAFRNESSKSSSAAAGCGMRIRRGSARCADGLSMTDGLSSRPYETDTAHRRTRHAERACIGRCSRSRSELSDFSERRKKSSLRGGNTERRLRGG